VIPYYPQPVWSWGPFTIHAFGVAAAAALLIGYWLVSTHASRHGIAPEYARRIFAITILGGLTGALLWSRIQGTPGISTTGVTLASFAILAAIGARDPDRFWSTLDLFGYALPFVYAIARFGCFLAHDHIGALTHSWLGVRFPEGTRFDLGLLYLISALATAAIVVWLNHRRPQPGVVFLTTITLLACSRLAILELSTPLQSDVFITTAIALLGITLLTFRYTHAKPFRL